LGVVQVLASTDLAEMAAICDNVLVFSGGRICATLTRERLDEHTILHAMNTGKLQ
jgi:ABC-type sugar transport system ATPase subunit